jgi:hypothetical protein
MAKLTLILPGAKLVLRSENSKLGVGVTATYLSQSTCPSSCPHRRNGCYAESGPTGFVTRSLEGLATEAIQNEVILIHRLASLIRAGEIKDPPPLFRLHVVGDVPNWGRARELARAVREWAKAIQALGLSPKAWTYTHNWREIPRHHWGNISVLASCESLRDAVLAREHGYVPALIVPEFKSRNAYMLPSHSELEHSQKSLMWVIPCPAQTSGLTCAQCQLCASSFRPMAAIGFEPHGSGYKRILHTIGAL